MKKTLFVIVLIVCNSCVPKQIIYIQENSQSALQADSIGLRVLEAVQRQFYGDRRGKIDFEITNNKKNNIYYIGEKSILKIISDSINQKYIIEKDTIYSVVIKHSIKIYTSFSSNHNPDIGKFIWSKKNMMNHQLYFYPYIIDAQGRKIEKCIILEPVKVKNL